VFEVLSAGIKTAKTLVVSTVDEVKGAFTVRALGGC
jgi:hypothetical protein